MASHLDGHQFLIAAVLSTKQRIDCERVAHPNKWTMPGSQIGIAITS
jgi:hypothetical protein